MFNSLTFKRTETLALDFRNTVVEKGYLDITTLTAAACLNRDDAYRGHVDWPNVAALVPLEDSGQYRTAIFYLDKGIVAVRLGIQGLLTQLGEHFLFKYQSDIRRKYADALQIRRQVPYVCRDFMMFPVKPNAYGHEAWIRFFPNDNHFDRRGKDTMVTFPEIGSLLLPLNKTEIKTRLEKVAQLRYYLHAYAMSFMPTPPNDYRPKHFNFQRFIRAMEVAAGAQVLKKFHGSTYRPDLLETAVDEIANNQFSQLDELDAC